MVTKDVYIIKKMTMMLWKVMGIVIIFILRIKKVSFG